ncbi:hypothetical protein EDB19DRAFT_1643054 [Suillus lakei]|nr:hypothetical protein EDB19DRAFT_1643054 [Suillus lakei]
MHRALLVSEVLLDIFAQLTENTPGLMSMTDRKSLAALARTCKTFYEAAMNELWANLYGLEPLLGCVTRLYPVIYPRIKKVNVEPLSEDEPCQFLRHSARVRSLDISSDNPFHLLSLIPFDTCIFPRLQSLVWGLLTPRYLDLFLSCMLRRCSLSVIDEGLKCIATHCATSLENLSVARGPITADELSLLTDSVRLCKRLVILSCPALDWAAWEHLSNLPTLLTVVIDKESAVPPPMGLKLAPFLNLTALSFYVDMAVTITTLVQHSEFPSLRKFEMVVSALPWREAERLFRALSQCKSCETLEHILIISKCSGLQEPSESGDSLTVIAQFLCFTQLRLLHLKFYHSILLDNVILLEAISSWPRIRSLKLEDTHHGTVTHRGLFAALRRCPHLHTLFISLNAVNVDIDPSAESFQHTTLRQLGLKTLSRVTDAEAVARIIFSMLPCVDEVITPGWQKVNLHLEYFIDSSAPGRHIAGASSKI